MILGWLREGIGAGMADSCVLAGGEGACQVGRHDFLAVLFSGTFLLRGLTERGNMGVAFLPPFVATVGVAFFSSAAVNF